jgi:hypothetical protein
VTRLPQRIGHHVVADAMIGAKSFGCRWTAASLTSLLSSFHGKVAKGSSLVAGGYLNTELLRPQAAQGMAARSQALTAAPHHPAANMSKAGMSKPDQCEPLACLLGEIHVAVGALHE